MHTQNRAFITRGEGGFTRSSGGRSEGPYTRSTSAWRPGRKDTRLGRVWTPGRAQGTSIQQSLTPKNMGPSPLVRAQLRTPGRAGSPQYWYPSSQEGPNTGYPESLLQATHLGSGAVRLEKHRLLVATPEGTVSHSEPTLPFPPAASPLHPGGRAPLPP